MHESTLNTNDTGISSDVSYNNPGSVFSKGLKAYQKIKQDKQDKKPKVVTSEDMQEKKDSSSDMIEKRECSTNQKKVGCKTLYKNIQQKLRDQKRKAKEKTEKLKILKTKVREQKDAFIERSMELLKKCYSKDKKLALAQQDDFIARSIKLLDNRDAKYKKLDSVNEDSSHTLEQTDTQSTN